MKTILILLAAPLAIAAAPAFANDCTAATSASAAQTAATNEAVVNQMLAYALEQGGGADCRTLTRAPDCVDCPERQAPGVIA